jgi:hypothetical protein
MICYLSQAKKARIIVNKSFMKNILLILSLFILANFDANAKVKSEIKKINDTLLKIQKIEFSYNSSVFDIRPLLEMPSYSLIIESNGNAVLKWPRKCPATRNNELICSYKGKISKKEFKKISRYLLSIDFLNLKEKYLQEPEPNSELYDHWGSASFTIFYNDNYYKKIIDENLLMPQLAKLREQIVILKKKIKWTPVLD